MCPAGANIRFTCSQVIPRSLDGCSYPKPKMSLLRLCQFWSFDLGALDSVQGECTSEDDPVSAHNLLAQQPAGCKFHLDIGLFQSIGPYQVFVCASLSGLICIVQVPLSQQPTYKASQSGREHAQLHQDRQLLLARHLAFPIANVRCGFFASALKQSIAVLGLDKLVVYEVKSKPLDLLSSINEHSSSSMDLDGCAFSHELEELYTISLSSPDIPAKLLVFENHFANTLSQLNGASSNSERKGSTNKARPALHLPQRDMIAIQYTNQFLYTLVEHKKVLGNFLFEEESKSYKDHSDVHRSALDQRATGRRDANLDQLCHFVGTMPATFLRSKSNPVQLVISFSDNQIYSLPLTKLLSLAKQTVMKRVAKNLVGQQESGAISEPISSLSYNNRAQNGASSGAFIVPVQLETLVSWKLKLPYAPLQMFNSPHPRKSTNSLDMNNPGCSMTDQLFVMSRYNVDLYDSSGEHLWSHRFEPPLRCASYYVSNHLKDDGQLSSEHCETHFMICTDSLSNNQSDITILSEDRLVWSALLACKPVLMWRVSLNNIKGAIALLQDDTDGIQLRLGYLGTQAEDSSDNLNQVGPTLPMAKINLLDEHFSSGDPSDRSTGDDSDSSVFKIDVKLEAYNAPPKAEVKFRIEILPRAQMTSVLHHIVGLLDYDDLLQCTIDGYNSRSSSLGGALQVQLGSCWPDRKDPLTVTGVFKLRTCSTDQLEEKGSPMYLHDNIMPKTLQVTLVLNASGSKASNVLQQMSFMLPLSLVATLEHVDYSYGSGPTLNDIFLNLAGYERQTAEGAQIEQTSYNPYYTCDIVIRNKGDVIDLLDELIESDLVCRSCNSESSSYAKLIQHQDRNMITLDNLNLLAQSLDCRLKYHSPSRPASIIRHQSSTDDHGPIVLASIAFKLSLGSQLLGRVSTNSGHFEHDLIWLHLCELTQTNSDLPREFLQLHATDWRPSALDTSALVQDQPAKHSVLLSIESKQLLAAMFATKHFLARIKSRSDRFPGTSSQVERLSEKHCDLIDMDYSNIYRFNDFLAPGESFVAGINELLEKRFKQVLVRFGELKSKLLGEYDKLYASCLASLALAKRIHDLPDDMQDQFNSISLLTKSYYLSQVGLLGQLEELKRLDYHYCKVPDIEELWSGSQQADSSEWLKDPHFVQIVD